MRYNIGFLLFTLEIVKKKYNFFILVSKIHTKKNLTYRLKIKYLLKKMMLVFFGRNVSENRINNY